MIIELIEGSNRRFSATGTLSTEDFKIPGLESLHIGPVVDFEIEVQAIKE